MNSEDQESGLDLYDEILVEDLTCQQESLHEVQIKYQEALRRISGLEDVTRQNETAILNLKKKNTYLMKNISVLYKTACTELERKKDVIESLRNQMASGADYDYTQDRRSRVPAHSYENIFESQNIENHRFQEGALVPYDNTGWEAQDTGLQFSDSDAFYSPHNSNYPNNAITASNTDAHHSTPDNQPPYDSLEILKKHMSKSKLQNSHAAHTMESTLADNYTPPTRNTDSHNNARDSSSHASHAKYTDEHTQHMKQTDSSTSHSKHSSSHISSRKHPGSKFSHSKHPKSKSPTSSHSDKRSSSSKRSHSDSRKHDPSGSRTSEPISSQSKHSESKKSGRSSRISSKDHEPLLLSSSSSRSLHKQFHSAERGDTKSAESSHRSGSSDSKNQDSRSDKRKRKASVGSCSSKDENSATSKRKRARVYSPSRESKSKRKHKKKSKLPKRSVSQCSETEQHLKSNSGGEEENSKFKNLPPQETDSPVTLERTNKEDSGLHDLRNNGDHESPTITGQDTTLETNQDPPGEMASSPITDEPETVIESKSLESVTREADHTTIAAQRSTSSSSGNSSHNSDIADTEGDAEKDLIKSEEELGIEINDPCSSILWAGKTLSDSDENSAGLENGTASDVDKLNSLSNVQKEEQSDPGTYTSDTSPEKPSIVIQCFGDDHENSRSPILIPCYPSKKSKSSSSASESDEDESHIISTPVRSVIARSLFPITNPTSDKSSEMGEGHIAPKQQIILASNNEDESLGKVNSPQACDESQLSDVSATQRLKKRNKLELNNNLDFSVSPILRKEADLSPTTKVVDSSICQNGDTELATSGKGEQLSDSSSDDNDTTVVGPLDKNNACSDYELEEGEVLSDEENESADANAATEKARSPVRYKSISPVEWRKSSGKRYREDCRKKPYREPMKSDPHNRQRSSADQFVSKKHWPSVIGNQSRYRDDRSGRNSVLPSGSGFRPQYRRLDGNHRQSGFNCKTSSSAKRKRKTH